MNSKTKLSSFLRLMRADKPIGSALLLWPTLMSFYLLTDGNPNYFLMSLFIIGTILMRSAGCVINDFFDRDFDGNVERTKERPIAAGEISPNEALLLFFFLVLCSACLLLFMNLLTFLMALLGLGLATFYPISKRFFPIPQVFLGLAFSWGIIMVSSAQLGEINILSLALFLSCFFWIIAYDTAYALCDKKDDLDLGIHSSAITFGKNVTAFFFLLHFLSITILILIAYLKNFHISFYFFASISSALVIYQCFLIKDQDSTNCLKAFKNNNLVGLSFLCGSILGVTL
ncbi:4-hydroxybenzoate octaprenyltransferase [Gammaproteobacteria bacterium]|nr:4-hydroxybenzoate octaprenyltransferase [Gammaproteobacteria bacterium]GIR87801.1 MAG: 4-hydroxybenzoate octaprenyltransferase [Gammaproteobacteria bacterium]|tara:strand:- start:18 stop:878 length:861 start_codon:yes stop_codon:yes gene_type:complete